MNEDAQLKLQAFLDGELPSREAADVAAWLANDTEAQALAAELKNTAAALAGNDVALALPEGRDFYWSKIRREIERPTSAPLPVPRLGWAGWLWRSLVPTAALALVCMLALRSGTTEAADEFSPELDVAADNMGANTYVDQQTGLTTVWYYNRADAPAAESAADAATQ